MIGKINNFNFFNYSESIKTNELKNGIIFKLLSDKSNIIGTISNTEEKILYDYNKNYKVKSAWVNSVNMNSIRLGVSTVGTSDNALATGGYDSNALNTTEIFNDTTWTNSVNMNSARYFHSTCGISNNALATGGRNESVYLNTTELFNGTTWTNSINMNNARLSHSTCGISNNALATGGNNGNHLNTTELFNGTMWTNSINMNSTRDNHSTCGISNNALATGGYYGSVYLNTTEIFNGITWTNSAIMNTDRYYHSTVGTSNNALATAGSSYARMLKSTEIFNGSEWSNGANMNVERDNHSTCGISNDALATGGYYTNIRLNTTEKYIELYKELSEKAIFNKFNIGGLKYDIKGNFKSSANLLYNISSHNNIGNSLNDINICGVTYADGNPGSSYITKYNSNTWATISSSSIQLSDASSSGIPNGFALFGGISVSSIINRPLTNNIYYYDGYNKYLNDTTLPLSIKESASSGKANMSIIVGGYSSSYLNSSILFNGFTCESLSNLPISVSGHTMKGNANSSILVGGKNSSRSSLDYTFKNICGSFSVKQSIPEAVVNHSSSGNSYSTIIIANNNYEFNGECWHSIKNYGSLRVSAAMDGHGSHSSILTGGNSTDSSTILLENFSYNDISSYFTIYQNNVLISDINNAEGAWHNSANIIAEKYSHSLIGTIHSAMSIGGVSASNYTNTVETFNNDVWSVYNSNTNFNRAGHSTGGNKNINITAGGKLSSSGNSILESEIFNGLVFATGTNIIGAKNDMYGQGKYNGFLLIGGGNADYYMYNGYIWCIIYNASSTNNNTYCGGYNSLINFEQSTIYKKNKSEHYSYTNPNSSQVNSRAIGNSNYAIISGGDNSLLTTNIFNGTSNTMSYGNLLNIDRSRHGCTGATDNILATGGYNSSYTSEIYTKLFIDKDLSIMLNTNNNIIKEFNKINIDIDKTIHNSCIINKYLDTEKILNDNTINTTINSKKLDSLLQYNSSIPIKLEYDSNIIKNNLLYSVSLDKEIVDIESDIYNDYIWKSITPRNESTLKTNYQFGTTIGSYNSCVYVDDTVEYFNSLSWSTKNNRTNKTYYGIGGLGSLYNNMGICGGFVSTTVYNNTELFNGASWSIGSGMSISRCNHAVLSRSTNASLIAGGKTSTSNESNSTSVELFDGESWSTSSISLDYSRTGWVKGCGTNTSGIVIGGSNYPLRLTKLNITSWESLGDIVLSNKSYYSCPAGRFNNSIMCGGAYTNNNNYVIPITERFDGEKCSVLAYNLSRRLVASIASNGEIVGSVMCEGDISSAGFGEMLYNGRYYINESILNLQYLDNDTLTIDYKLLND